MKKIFIILATTILLSAAKLPQEAFFRAIETGDSVQIEQMIKDGIDVNIKDARGNTALMEAAARGYEKLVKLFIEKGADVNAKNDYGETALLLVVRHSQDMEKGPIEAVRWLLEKNVDVNVKDEWEGTALSYAIMWGHTEIADLLRAAGAVE